jgi:hypothetical protein
MKTHKFDSTMITHHDDGSHTVHHMHEDGPEHDDIGAVNDHDSLLDNLCDHLDPEKVESELKSHGIDSEKLEELISPGIHNAMAGLIGE